jgi:hypothetical protein
MIDKTGEDVITDPGEPRLARAFLEELAGKRWLT